MFKKLLAIFIIVPFLIIYPWSAKAHSGRLDGSGGHKVNKKYVYDGRFMEVRNGKTILLEGKIVFDKGDYHYHIHPRYTEYKDGIYLPVKEKDVGKTITENLHISDENRVASNKSNIYHRPTCIYVKGIDEKNAIIFEDFEDAENSLYKPCKRCKPNDWR